MARQAQPPAETAADVSAGPVRPAIHVMLENRSFDQISGALQNEARTDELILHLLLGPMEAQPPVQRNPAHVRI